MNTDDRTSRTPLDIVALMKANEGRNYELHSAHVNPSNVRTLKTIGFDRCYVRAEGQYLWDVEGVKYLDTSRPEWQEMKPILDVMNEALKAAGKN